MIPTSTIHCRPWTSFVRVRQHPRAQGRFAVIAAMDPQPRPVLTTMAVQLRVALSRATETLALVDVAGDDDALALSAERRATPTMCRPLCGRRAA